MAAAVVRWPVSDRLDELGDREQDRKMTYPPETVGMDQDDSRSRVIAA